MSTPPMLRQMRHDVWATERLLRHLRAMSAQQLQLTVPGTYGNILRTLMHLVAADERYLRRFFALPEPLLDDNGPDLSLDEIARHLRNVTDGGAQSPTSRRIESEEAACHAEFMRDIFGNPFRPVTADPAWLTSDVVALATSIYAEKAFDRLPILADALQDAGCDNADVLDHCRSDGPHVRGCWVVDLLLGKP